MEGEPSPDQNQPTLPRDLGENLSVSNNNGIRKPLEVDANNETLRISGEKPPQISDTSKLIISLVALYIIIGALIYPYYWYQFFFEHGYSNKRTWNWGIGYLEDYYLVPALIITLIVFVILFTSKPSFLYRFIKGIWHIVSYYTSGRRGSRLIAVLLLLCGMSIFTLGIRTKEEREASQRAIQEYEQEKRKLLEAARRQVSSDEPPLSVPTSFIFLSKENVESLYGQYEPELIPASVIEEIKDSTDIKGEINLEDFLKTEAGKNMLQRKLTEYRQTSKNEERKLKDLARYLYDNGLLKRYGNMKTNSDEIKEIDQATKVLS
ncbi:MAG: hypothetical protein M3362_23525, partial [Acidobacteriota bacterium]|nr:hypothetical protein [Acidobacteriota bacterium]